MGFASGFDIWPPLEVNEDNKKAYQRFIDEVIKEYQDVHDDGARHLEGGKVLLLPDDTDRWHGHGKEEIVFMIGEGPAMPSSPDHCNLFLRFSSEVSGDLNKCAQPYIVDVGNIAKKHFGDRVHFWHDSIGGAHAIWTWRDIHAAREELKKRTQVAIEDGDSSKVGMVGGNDADTVMASGTSG